MLGAVIDDASFGKVKRHLDLKVELIGAVSNLFFVTLSVIIPQILLLDERIVKANKEEKDELEETTSVIGRNGVCHKNGAWHMKKRRLS